MLGDALQYCRGGIGIHLLDTIQPGRVNAPLAPLNAAWYIISKGHAAAESVTQYVATRSSFNYMLHVYTYTFSQSFRLKGNSWNVYIHCQCEIDSIQSVCA